MVGIAWVGGGAVGGGVTCCAWGSCASRRVGVRAHDAWTCRVPRGACSWGKIVLTLGGEGEGLLLLGLREPGLERVVVGPAAALKSLLGGVGAAGVAVHELTGFIGAFDDERGEPGDVVGKGIGEWERVGDGAGVGEAEGLKHGDAGVAGGGGAANDCGEGNADGLDDGHEIGGVVRALDGRGGGVDEIVRVDNGGAGVGDGRLGGGGPPAWSWVTAGGAVGWAAPGMAGRQAAVAGAGAMGAGTGGAIGAMGTGTGGTIGAIGGGTAGAGTGGGM